MKTIYKYELEVSDMQKISMPEGAEILTVQVQQGNPYLWAFVDIKAKERVRYIETFGTGHEMPQGMGIDRKYIGTYQLRNGDLVFHVFEYT